jgi:hypothetical protein
MLGRRSTTAALRLSRSREPPAQSREGQGRARGRARRRRRRCDWAPLAISEARAIFKIRIRSGPESVEDEAPTKKPRKAARQAAATLASSTSLIDATAEDIIEDDGDAFFSRRVLSLRLPEHHAPPKRCLFSCDVICLG